jgi:hypothetical protein
MDGTVLTDNAAEIINNFKKKIVGDYEHLGQ